MIKMHNSILPLFIAKLNIAKRGHFKTIKVKHSIKVMELLKMFEELGIIRGYNLLFEENLIKVFLKYVGNYSFRSINLISKSSRRIYVSKIRLYKLKNKYSTDVYILSTNNGLKFDYECYRKGIGGELLLKITF